MIYFSQPMTKPLLALALVLSPALLAQTAETHVFRAAMRTSNETPPVTDTPATGGATIRVHAVRNAAGEIISGSVDFNLGYTLPANYETYFTGFHIHRGAPGVAGGVVINTGLSNTNTIRTAGGPGRVDLQAQIRPGATGFDAALQALKDLLVDPSGFYVNIHTAAYPGGLIRGQLERAEEIILMAQMSARNEIPVIDSNAGGTISITAIRGYNAAGAINSGEVTFDVDYAVPEAVTFTGFHIHVGDAVTNGPVRINTGISGAASVPSAANGTGNLKYIVEVNVADANTRAAFDLLWNNPGGTYANLHTTVYPGGFIRAQLRRTDKTVFPVVMTTSNEVPPAAQEASAVGFVQVNSLRAADGSMAVARTTFDINHRVAEAADFTGLHIHNGPAGVAGGVTVSSGLSGANNVLSTTGFGNITRAVNSFAANSMATLNSMMTRPENHYVNLHSTHFPGGVVRAQMGVPVTSVPSIGGILSADFADANRRTSAPGGLISIFGANMARVQGELSGWQGDTLPASFNGASVTIGGKAAPLLFVSGGQINAQVPADSATGEVPVIVRNVNGDSNVFNLTVAANAPGIFVVGSQAIALKNSDFSLITNANAAAAGEAILFYTTGMGQTTPPITTGKPVAVTPQSDTAPVTVTIGGVNATVVYSIASPGFVGLYQVAVIVPAGVTPGLRDVVIRQNGVNSNTAQITIR